MPAGNATHSRAASRGNPGGIRMTKVRQSAAAFALIAAVLALTATAAAHAQGAIEKTKVTIAVGGKAGLYYLPLTIAERLGYFKDEGLDVTIPDFAGGSKSLQAVVGGSADVVSGAYEHTINMQSRGQRFQAFVLMGRAPQISVGVATKKMAGYKSEKDLKGMKIGVSAPGSSTNMVADFVLAKGGLKPTDASFVGVGSGAGAIAAIKSGQIDAMSNVDPVMTILEHQGAIKIIADARTMKGTVAIFGGPIHAASLYAPLDFVKKNPNTVQALTNAIVRALLWMQNASPQQILDTVPEEYLLGDKAMYLFAYNAVRDSYSTDGIIGDAGAKNELKALAQSNPDIHPDKINLAETYDNSFVLKALKKYRK
jgi:NitT/TauT family transport system substrate-binding protein